MGKISQIRSSYKAAKNQGLDKGWRPHCSEWGKDCKLRAVLIYLSCLTASWQGTSLSQRGSQHHIAQNRPRHVLLLSPQELGDCWRRDEGLWRISGNTWKHEVMRNSYSSCYYIHEIQKSHRKTGCINSCDQEITCSNTCLLNVHCRKGRLCQIPGTRRHKMVSCRMSPEAGGEQFVLHEDWFPCAVLSWTADSVQVQGKRNKLTSKERWLNSLKLSFIHGGQCP